MALRLTDEYLRSVWDLKNETLKFIQMENKSINVENSTNAKTDANTVLAAGVVVEIADLYEEQVRLEKLYQEDKEQKIKELEKLISSSKNAPIYKKFYKPEYGDYRQFVETIAVELRRRNACR